MRRPSSVLSVTAPLVLLLVGCHRPPEPSFQPEPAQSPSSHTDMGSVGTTGSAGGDQASRGAQSPATPASPPAGPGATAPAAMPPATAAAATGAIDPRLLDPSRDNATAPARYTVALDTTKGKVLIDVTRSWSPHGADRFYNLVKIGFFTDVAFFRVISGFMAQAGISGTPQIAAAWDRANIPDDPVVKHNTRGMVSFATAGPNSRATQFFIDFGDNSRLDSMGFSPIGKVRDMRPVDALYSGYGEGAPGGRGPSQGEIQHEGNAYLHASFPQLDYIRSARIVSAH